MKTAVISDIHGNAPALKSIVDDAVADNVDRFIFIGDYIFDLPFSNEVVEIIMQLPNAHIIACNKETFLRRVE